MTNKFILNQNIIEYYYCILLQSDLNHFWTPIDFYEFYGVSYLQLFKHFKKHCTFFFTGNSISTRRGTTPQASHMLITITRYNMLHTANNGPNEVFFFVRPYKSQNRV